MIDYSDLIGVPFKDGGRDYHTGLDCYGLVMEVYRRMGIELPEYYAPAMDSEAVNAQFKDGIHQWERVDGNVPMSMIAIKFNSSVVNHTGVYLGNCLFLHTRERIGCNVDRVDSPAWRRCIEGYYIYKGSDNQ